MACLPELHRAARKLYKELIFLGREYPGGADKFRKACHRAFLRNSEERDPEKIRKLLAHGEYVVCELEALYSLRKYRTLKKRYYE